MNFKNSTLIVLISILITPLTAIAGRNDSDWVNFGMFRPAFLPHANLPHKGLFRFGATLKVIDVDPTDFNKDGTEDFVHFNHSAGRNETVFSLFYGLTDNIVLIAKVPQVSSFSKGTIHPSGAKSLNLNVEGSAHAIGDINLTLKKRWLKQKDKMPISFATITGISLPTGKNDGKWDDQLVIGKEDTNGIINYDVAFNGQNFTRFSDDGRLPTPLQPGTGAFSGTVGLVFTKIFYKFPGAIHIGAVAQFRDKTDGINFGNEIRYFATYFKTIYKQHIIFEFAVNGAIKENDEYSGVFTHPVVDADGNVTGTATTARPSFKGGSSIRFTPSLLLSPTKGFRVAASYSLLLNNPDLGPWAKDVYQIGFTYEF